MFREDIHKKIVDAMKAHDEVRVMTLKLLSTSLLNAEIAKNRVKLTPEEEIQVVKKEAKKRRDAIEIYEKAGVKDRVEKETEELKILEEFLPERLPESEIEKVVEAVIKDLNVSSASEMGRVIGETLKRLEGKADGSQVVPIVKVKLAK